MLARHLVAALTVALAPACSGPDPSASAGAGAGASAGAGSDATSDASGSSSASTSTSTSATSGDSASATSGATSSPTSDPTTSPTTDPTSDPTTGELPPFVHDFHTLLVDGRLALTSNLPPALADCEALPFADPPCADLDADGLVDAWEDVALDRLRPLRRMDEDEEYFTDAKALVADVGRVAAVADGHRLFVMLGYSEDYGSCGGFTGHHGDSERVALDLAPYPEGGAGGVIVREAYTAAHEGTANDHSRRFTTAELGELRHGLDPGTREPRWVVFPSANKHATYANIAICEGISIIPCIDEDCAPDGVDDPGAYDLLPPAGNAGEESSPRLTDLTALGFPGDDAWKDQDFCGGLGPGACSSAVREKLLVDPF